MLNHHHHVKSRPPNRGSRKNAEAERAEAEEASSHQKKEGPPSASKNTTRKLRRPREGRRKTITTKTEPQQRQKRRGVPEKVQIAVETASDQPKRSYHVSFIHFTMPVNVQTAGAPEGPQKVGAFVCLRNFKMELNKKKNTTPPHTFSCCFSAVNQVKQSSIRRRTKGSFLEQSRWC